MFCACKILFISSACCTSAISELTLNRVPKKTEHAEHDSVGFFINEFPFLHVSRLSTRFLHCYSETKTAASFRLVGFLLLLVCKYVWL